MGSAVREFNGTEGGKTNVTRRMCGARVLGVVFLRGVVIK